MDSCVRFSWSPAVYAALMERLHAEILSHLPAISTMMQADQYEKCYSNERNLDIINSSCKYSEF